MNDRDYYNQSSLWSEERYRGPRESSRASSTVSAVPDDVATVLEVGCGNGAVLHEVAARRQVCGVDVSRAALAVARFPRALAASSELPFRDRAFDLVMACEVIEHLPDAVLRRTLGEMARVARKYVLITVPNAEDTFGNHVRCPRCGCVFHPSRHLRSFDEARLRSLLPGFTVSTVSAIGPREVSANARLTRLHRAMFGFPASKTPTWICPQCGEPPPANGQSAAAGAPAAGGRRSLLGPGLGLAKRAVRGLLFPTGMKTPWLLALYQRRAAAPDGDGEVGP